MLPVETFFPPAFTMRALRYAFDDIIDADGWRLPDASV